MFPTYARRLRVNNVGLPVLPTFLTILWSIVFTVLTTTVRPPRSVYLVVIFMVPAYNSHTRVMYGDQAVQQEISKIQVRKGWCKFFLLKYFLCKFPVVVRL